jgi:hypothetical protein
MFFKCFFSREFISSNDFLLVFSIWATVRSVAFVSRMCSNYINVSKLSTLIYSFAFSSNRETHTINQTHHKPTQYQFLNQHYSNNVVLVEN